MQPDADIRSVTSHRTRSAATYANIPQSMRTILDEYHLPGEEDVGGKAGSPEEWRTAQRLAYVSVAHWVVCAAITLYLLGTGQRRRVVKHWARFLGISGTLLAMGQYLPQIVHTARARLVRSLSIPTMCFQVPGTLLFVYALWARKGTDWTSLLAYIMAGILQLMLLVLCICWKVRQARLNIDDFGRPRGGAEGRH